MVTNFSFEALSAIEFEELCSSFLQKWDHNEYERFAEGRDGGIDLRCVKRTRGKVPDITIFQCKRYGKFSDLYATLKSEEIGKVQKLRPTRYGLLTTCSLTPMNKAKVMSLFAPFSVREKDIIGREELNDRLSRKAYVPIVERTLPLWWQSFGVLQETLYNRVKGRSRDVVKTYAERNAHSHWTHGMAQVVSSLRKYRVAVLVGNPGVGKTTAAEVVLLKMMKRGYAPIVVERSIDEAEDVWDERRRQVFYFDDFLGKCYYEAVNRSQESGVWRFIRRVAGARNKLLILTSRTTVLKRSVVLSDAYRDSGMGEAPFFCNINELTKLEKAHILYNRMVASPLPMTALDVILARRNYMKLIEHRNFNPRLVEYVLRDAPYGNATAGEEFLSKALEFLGRPVLVWKQLFTQQINKVEQSIVWAVFLSDSLGEERMVELFADLLECPYLADGTGGPADYETAMQGLAGSVLVRRIGDGGAVDYVLHDPSIGDYLVGECATSVPYAKAALKSLTDLRATRKFLGLMKDRKISVRTRFEACAYVARDMSFEDRKAQAVLCLLCAEMVRLDVRRGRQVVREKFGGMADLNCEQDAVEEIIGLVCSLEDGEPLSWRQDMGFELDGDGLVELMRRCEDFESCARLSVIALDHALCGPAPIGEILSERLGPYAADHIMWRIDAPGFDIVDEDTWAISPREEARIARDLRSLLTDEVEYHGLPPEIIDIDGVVGSFDFRDHFQPDPDELAEYRDDGCEEEPTNLLPRDESTAVSDIDRLFGGFRR